jgi:uncharacterized protein YndB with AHSA1/START domain
MLTISKSREVHAAVDSVWAILSDTDNDPKYWTNIRDVKVTGRDGNRIEREANVGPRAFSQKSRQTLLLDPKKSIKLTMTAEALDGERVMLVVPVAADTTRIDVTWNLTPTGVPTFVQGIVKNQIAKATEDALAKIAKEAESMALDSSDGMGAS